VKKEEKMNSIRSLRDELLGDIQESESEDEFRNYQNRKPSYKPRFIDPGDENELLNLYRLSSMRYSSSKGSSKHDRMLWASREFAKAHSDVKESGAYKDLDGLLSGGFGEDVNESKLLPKRPFETADGKKFETLERAMLHVFKMKTGGSEMIYKGKLPFYVIFKDGTDGAVAEFTPEEFKKHSDGHLNKPEKFGEDVELDEAKFVPNDEQLEALKAWKKRYGKDWKTELNIAWQFANYGSEFRDQSHLLQQLRNKGGPTWLSKFKLDEAAIPGLKFVCRKHGLNADEATKLLQHPKYDKIMKAVDEFQRKNGFPLSDSPLVRGLIRDLVSGKERLEDVMDEAKEISKKDIEKAEKFGREAFHRGQKAIPALDKYFDRLLSKLALGAGTGESVPLLKAWQRGWNDENFKNESKDVVRSIRDELLEKAEARWHWVEDEDEKIIFVGTKAQALSYYKKHGGSSDGLHLLNAAKRQGGPPPEVGKKFEDVEMSEDYRNTSFDMDQEGGLFIAKVDVSGKQKLMRITRKRVDEVLKQYPGKAKDSKEYSARIKEGSPYNIWFVPAAYAKEGMTRIADLFNPIYDAGTGSHKPSFKGEDVIRSMRDELLGEASEASQTMNPDTIQTGFELLTKGLKKYGIPAAATDFSNLPMDPNEFTLMEMGYVAGRNVFVFKHRQNGKSMWIDAQTGEVIIPDSGGIPESMGEDFSPGSMSKSERLMSAAVDDGSPEAIFWLIDNYGNRGLRHVDVDDLENAIDDAEEMEKRMKMRNKKYSSAIRDAIESYEKTRSPLRKEDVELDESDKIDKMQKDFEEKIGKVKWMKGLDQDAYRWLKYRAGDPFCMDVIVARDKGEHSKEFYDALDAMAEARGPAPTNKLEQAISLATEKHSKKEDVELDEVRSMNLPLDSEDRRKLIVNLYKQYPNFAKEVKRWNDRGYGPSHIEIVVNDDGDEMITFRHDNYRTPIQSLNGLLVTYRNAFNKFGRNKVWGREEGYWIDITVEFPKGDLSKACAGIFIPDLHDPDRPLFFPKEDVSIVHPIREMANELLGRLDEKCKTPGMKIRSKGKGRGLARGKGRGPLGIPARIDFDTNDVSMNEQSDKEIADTILDQMGGMRRIGAMIGARSFTMIKNGVQIHFPNKQRSKPNYVAITLDRGSDTYDVKFMRIDKGGAPKTTAEYHDIYSDSLKNLFEKETGLYLSL
jgi:hypothetical protein